MNEQSKRNHRNRSLTTKQQQAILLWSGDIIAAARAAGYSEPAKTAYRLMKNPEFTKQLMLKQETMIKESAKLLAREITVCRADLINRLWEFAQLAPGETSHTITGQIKAAEILSRIFDVKINRTADLDREIEGKAEEEMDYFVAHGYFPEPGDLEKWHATNEDR